MKRLLTTTTVVVASALFLAGCGGGSDGDPETSPAMDMADEQKMDISTAITAAENAVDMAVADAMAVGAADAAIAAARDAIDAATGGVDTDGYTTAVDALDNRLDDAKTAHQAAAAQAAMDRADADRARNAMAKKLYAGLGEGSTSLDNASIEITAGVVMGKPDESISDDTVTFKKTDTMVMGYGSWKGTDYVVKNSAMTDHAVVYNNQGAGKQVPFKEKHTSTTDEGRLPDNTLMAEASRSLIASSMFASGSGSEDHTEEEGDNANILGTYDGASGLYQCSQSGTTPCRSQVADNDGGIILTGGWTFKPDTGAMVTQAASGEYVAYGWWSRETSNGVDVVALVDDVGSTDSTAGTTNTVTGTATYEGGAAGKYAIHDPLVNNSESGAFTAAATLTAKFGDGTAEGTISGMLTDFMAGGNSKNWEVELRGSGTSDEADILAGRIGSPDNADAANTAKTVWSIDGEKAAMSGSWSGNFYDATTEGAGNAPMTAAGEFKSEYGNVGRMTGAFGATKKE